MRIENLVSMNSRADGFNVHGGVVGLTLTASQWDVCVLRELPTKGQAAEVLRVHELCKTFGMELAGQRADAGGGAAGGS